MPTNMYEFGDTVRFSAVFTDSSDVDVDPTAVQFLLRVPAGTETTYTTITSPAVTKDSTGHYHIDIPITDANGPGVWYYRFNGTGTNAAASEGTINVSATAFADPLP